MQSFILSTDAAKGMQRKHSKLMRDLDRVRSMLPPDQRMGQGRSGNTRLPPAA